MGYHHPQFYHKPPSPPMFGIPQQLGSHVYHTPQPTALDSASNISESENTRRHDAPMAAAKAAGGAVFKAFYSSG
jgi:hypothetical protein